MEIPEEIQHKYRAFDDLIEGVQIIDNSLKYVYVNKTAARHGKTTIDALLGFQMHEKYPGIESTEIYNLIKECLNKKTYYELDNKFEFHDKTVNYFRLRLQPVIEGVLVMSFDITHQKNAEEKLINSFKEKERLLEIVKDQKNRLEEFCHIIAHNMRGPLINLTLLNELIKGSTNNSEKEDLLNRQLPIIEYLNETFEELVNITYLESNYNSQECVLDIRNCVSKILSRLNGTIQETNANIIIDTSSSNKVIYVEKYLENILFNLIENAIKYRSLSRDPVVEIKSRKQDGWCYIDVKDNGLGLDLNKFGHELFKLKKTFHDNPLARGFGLYLIKNQIESMGGTIHMQSMPNVGSTFTVKLTSKIQD